MKRQIYPYYITIWILSISFEIERIQISMYQPSSIDVHPKHATWKACVSEIKGQNLLAFLIKRNQR